MDTDAVKSDTNLDPDSLDAPVERTETDNSMEEDSAKIAVNDDGVDGVQADESRDDNLVKDAQDESENTQENEEEVNESVGQPTNQEEIDDKRDEVKDDSMTADESTKVNEDADSTRQSTSPETGPRESDTARTETATLKRQADDDDDNDDDDHAKRRKIDDADVTTNDLDLDDDDDDEKVDDVDDQKEVDVSMLDDEDAKLLVELEESLMGPSGRVEETRKEKSSDCDGEEIGQSSKDQTDCDLEHPSSPPLESSSDFDLPGSATTAESYAVATSSSSSSSSAHPASNLPNAPPWLNRLDSDSGGAPRSKKEVMEEAREKMQVKVCIVEQLPIMI